MQPSPRRGYLLCVVAAMAWAGTAPGLSYLLEAQGAAPLALAFWRDAFIALACLAGIAVATLGRRRGLPRLSAAELRGFAITGALSVGVYHALFVTSIALNGAALAVVLIYLYPVFVSLGARLLFHEQIGPAQIVALALAIIGCGLLVRIYDPAVLRVSWLGMLVGVCSALAHAGYVLFNQRAVSNHSPWLSLALTMSAGALVLLLLNLLVGGPASLLAVGAGVMPWLALLGLALGPTLLGYALFTSSLRHIPGRIASLLMVLEAPLATLMAVLLLGETIMLAQWLGIALVLVAAVLPGLPLRLPRRAAEVAAGD